MWIKTQKNNELLKVERFQILPSGKRSVNIVGYYEMSSFWGEKYRTLGNYDTIEEGNKELENIKNYIVENPNGVYQIK